MPRGDKSSYSSKQKRMAEHIEDSEKKQGRSSKTAGRIAWATVNKRTGGAKGRGRRGSSSRGSSSKRGGRSKRTRSSSRGRSSSSRSRGGRSSRSRSSSHGRSRSRSRRTTHARS